MSQQTDYTETSPATAGLGVTPVASLIPNGQPPHWTKPPISYTAKQPRPFTVQQASSNPFAANGTQTPHNPGSLSSQSSRDPSPIPPTGGSLLSSSTPNLTAIDNPSPQGGRTSQSNIYSQPGSESPLKTPAYGSSQPHLPAGVLPSQSVPSDQRYNNNPGLQPMGFSSPHINGPNVGISSTSRIVRTNMAGTVTHSGVQDAPEYLNSSKGQQDQQKIPYTQTVTQLQSSGQFPFHQQQWQRMQVNSPSSVPLSHSGQSNFQGLPNTTSDINKTHANFQQTPKAQHAFQNPHQVIRPNLSGQQRLEAVSSQQASQMRTQPQVNQPYFPAGSQYPHSVSGSDTREVNRSLNQTHLTRTNQSVQPVVSQPQIQGQNQIISTVKSQLQLPGSPVHQTFTHSRPQGQSQLSHPIGQPLGQNQATEMAKANTQFQTADQPSQPFNRPFSEASPQQSKPVASYAQSSSNSPATQFTQAGTGQSQTQNNYSYMNSPSGQIQQQQTSFNKFPQQLLAGAVLQSGMSGPDSDTHQGQNNMPQIGNQLQPQAYKSGPPPPMAPQFQSPVSKNQQSQYTSAPPASQITHVMQQQQHQNQQQQMQYQQQQQYLQQQQLQQQQLQQQQQFGEQQHSASPWNTQQSTNSQHTQHHLMSKRYPQQSDYQTSNTDNINQMMSGMSITQQGFNKLWGQETCDLLQNRNILPPEKIEPPKIKLHQEFLDSVNCSPDLFRCTLTKIPETSSLLQKSRLPLGILIHPYKDLTHLPVVQCNVIVRCRSCRTYINPFVYFVDHKRWKCNLCFRANELPEEFQFDPISRTYGDPSRRPEIKSATIEFIASSEYMLRPPQPAVYLFLLDVSALAVESGYLQIFCETLLKELDNLPGDGRTTVGFITFDSTIHFYSLAEGLNQPHQMIVVDIDDVFLPCPDNLLVNLGECRELVRDLLQQLPQKFAISHDNQSVLGAALQAAHKLISPTGGRVTVFQSCLPNLGPGALSPREDPSQRAGKEAPHLNPATDFYKRLALDCSGHQVAVDLFIVNSQYCDLATISGISRFSGGCIHHFPLFKSSNVLQAESFQRTLRRYLIRKIGFEAVMRIRCSRGLAIHTFHGNFFVRSTDLLSLPNVNPDAGFGMQISIEENLTDLQNVCFQAALLYTSNKGERRIRVHTMCLPVASSLPDILHFADQQCIIGLLAKMAVDRSHESSLSDARDAFINVAIDVLSAFKLAQGSVAASGGLVAPMSLRLLPLYILALLKYTAFRTGQSTRLDDRLFAMCQMKSLPLSSLIKSIYPDMYPVHSLSDQGITLDDGEVIPQPPRLHLSAEKLDFRGAFLMDTGDHMMIYVGRNISPEFLLNAFGVQSFSMISEDMYELPVLDTVESERLLKFIKHLQSERPVPATLEVIRDDSPRRGKFLERLIEDRTESALSYYEFLQHLKSNIK